MLWFPFVSCVSRANRSSVASHSIFSTISGIGKVYTLLKSYIITSTGRFRSDMRTIDNWCNNVFDRRFAFRATTRHNAEPRGDQHNRSDSTWVNETDWRVRSCATSKRTAVQGFEAVSGITYVRTLPTGDHSNCEMAGIPKQDSLMNLNEGRENLEWREKRRVTFQSRCFLS